MTGRFDFDKRFVVKLKTYLQDTFLNKSFRPENKITIQQYVSISKDEKVIYIIDNIQKEYSKRIRIWQ